MQNPVQISTVKNMAGEGAAGRTGPPEDLRSSRGGETSPVDNGPVFHKYTDEVRIEMDDCEAMASPSKHATWAEHSRQDRRGCIRT